MGKTLRKLFFVLFISLFFVPFSQAFDLEPFYLPKVKVMNQNMYLGADLSPLLGGDLTQMPIVVGNIIRFIISYIGWRMD